MHGRTAPLTCGFKTTGGTRPDHRTNYRNYYRFLLPFYYRLQQHRLITLVRLQHSSSTGGSLRLGGVQSQIWKLVYVQEPRRQPIAHLAVIFLRYLDQLKSLTFIFVEDKKAMNTS